MFPYPKVSFVVLYTKEGELLYHSNYRERGTLDTNKLFEKYSSNLETMLVFDNCFVLLRPLSTLLLCVGVNENENEYFCELVLDLLGRALERKELISRELVMRGYDKLCLLVASLIYDGNLVSDDLSEIEANAHVGKGLMSKVSSKSTFTDFFKKSVQKMREKL